MILYITNGKLVTPTKIIRGTLVINDGKIVDIGEGERVSRGNG